jgi:hypothetical protein
MNTPPRLGLLALSYKRPLLVFGAVAALSLSTSFIAPPWQAWQPSLCFPNCFCEAIRPGFVRQPANTFSNLGYVLVGLLIALSPQSSATASAQNLLRSHSGYTTLYGWAVVSIGIGSLFYHASLTYTGQFFDWVGMYAFISFVAVYNAVRLWGRRLPGIVFGLAYAVVLGGLCINFFINPHERTTGFQNLVLISLGLEALVLIFRRPRANRWLLAGAIGCLVAARLIWGWDINGTVCAPESLLQDHALWHLLTAGTTALLYGYYLSENTNY